MRFERERCHYAFWQKRSYSLRYFRFSLCALGGWAMNPYAIRGNGWLGDRFGSGAGTRPRYRHFNELRLKFVDIGFRCVRWEVGP
jgi:hypothetical protein